MLPRRRNPHQMPATTISFISAIPQVKIPARTHHAKIPLRDDRWISGRGQNRRLHQAGRAPGFPRPAGRVITNDQSVNLVDTARVRAAGFPVQEITGGCFCCKFDTLVEASRQLTRSTAPDVLIAEPVGSCTDLMATVGYPLRQLYGDDYDLSPLSVLVDPIRCARILGIADGRNFSEKVLYVYRKQLEEAELLVINKVDLLTAADRRALADAVKKQFPRGCLRCRAAPAKGWRAGSGACWRINSVAVRPWTWITTSTPLAKRCSAGSTPPRT